MLQTMREREARERERERERERGEAIGEEIDLFREVVHRGCRGCQHDGARFIHQLVHPF